MSRESVNNSQLSTFSGGGGASLSILSQKRILGRSHRIIVTTVTNNYINNYILSFSSFLNNVKVEINGF